MNERPVAGPLAAAVVELRRALAETGRAVLVAPPGTGKTTRVPLALLEEPWMTDERGAPRRILMLEPRRIAARSAAEYTARLLGEPVGGRVGYRTRGDSKVGPATRIEVVTERLLTRRLQRDPELAEIGLVIFDEIHERSLDTDLGLALCLDVATSLRPDLRLLAMSATPDTESIAAVLGDGGAPATVIESESVSHEITTVHLGRDAHRRLEDEVTTAVSLALRSTTEGDVLVFLPGRREIRFTAERLTSLGIDSVPLTAGLDSAALEAALHPDPTGRRKVILATSVAQTSLTIDGVRVVVDAGLERADRFDPARGMGGLVTVPVSMAAADQRRGRAGRQSPGQCYRLWSAAEETGRRAQSEPAINTADLCQLVLDVAAWGVADPEDLRWISRPPAASWTSAAATLQSIGALDEHGRITPDGRRIAELGAHPRLGRLMLEAQRTGDPALGALVAATIESGVRGDLCRSVERPEREVRRVADQWLRSLGERRSDRDGEQPAGHDDDTIGSLIAMAFPERVARRRGEDRHRYLTAGGIGVALPHDSPLGGADWLAISEVERGGGPGGPVGRGGPAGRGGHGAGAARSTNTDERILSAAPLGGPALDEYLAGRLERRTSISADRDGTISARTTWNLGAIVVRDDPSTVPSTQDLVDAASRLLAERGPGLLRWTDSARELQCRAAFARELDPSVPDCSDPGIGSSAAEWLPAHLPNGARGRRRLRLGEINAGEVLAGLLDWNARRRIDDLAPVDLLVPSGRRHRIDYGAEGGPVVRVKLQEMFGAAVSPSVGGGRVAVTLHLLSPAGRPLQVTSDLASFWAGAYEQVRSEMRGRYPKHPWPQDPTAATPTTATRRRTRDL